MISTQQHAQYIQLLQSPDPVEVYSALRTIKNTIIGSSTKKSLYFRLQIIPHVTSLLALDDTDVQIRVQSTAIISSLAHKDESTARQLLDSGAMTPLVNQIAPGTDPVLMEASERALNALLSYSSTKMGVEEHTGTIIPYLISIITESKEANYGYGMRTHARIELAVLILGKLCATEARQYTIANTGVIDLLIPLLTRGYPKLQIATLRTLSAMSYENMEICSALATMSHSARTFPAIVLGLARSRDPEIRLSACLCLSNLSRMRVHAGPQKDIQTVAVPALVKLMGDRDMDQLQVIQALGYLCHEDLDIQAAAKNAGAIAELTRILTEIEGQEKADFVDQERNVKMAKIVFLTLGTIVSTDEECRKKAVDSNVLWHLVKAMGHRDAGVKAAACLCARYIVRSVSICRTHLPESGILKPLLKLLSDESEDVKVTASATLVNLLTDLSPMKSEALKEGAIELLLKLLDSGNVTVRRNALWSIMNTLSSVDDDTKKEVLEKVKLERIYQTAADDSEPVVQEYAVGIIRNVANECLWGINALFDTLGSDRVLQLVKQLLQSSFDPVVIHTLYLINNIAIRSQPHCDLFVKSKDIMQEIAKYASTGSPDIMVGALWCINSIAIHRAPTQPTDADADASSDLGGTRYLSELNEAGIHTILLRLAQDSSTTLEVRDRVKTCLDYFV